ncbi:MAG TPA: adenylate/guanylate cyclase domain-containing protein [Stellaceae bacterium]|nr:adenylate/guanylate cyclase domain-containing protein [Stellaceae bacterium]
MMPGRAMLRRLRLVAGLTMLAYVTMHLVNHAMGLVSIEAMERTLTLFETVWGNPAGQFLLYGGFAMHYALALWALWQRRSLKLRGPELAQLLLGFAIPFLLIRHVAATRISADFLGTNVGYYRYFLWVYFVNSPGRGFLQLLVLVVAWAHAMIGLHYWLRVRPWYARAEWAALVLAVLLPVLALLGAVEAGRQVAALAAQPGWRGEAFAGLTLPTHATGQAIDTISNAGIAFFAVALTLVLAARLVRQVHWRARGLVRISYPDGRSIEVVRGTSVLEASRLANIPHASVCGGRGRCSTCRIRVRAAAGALDPPGESELRVLRRIRATPDVRLACMLRPTGAITAMPLLPPFAAAADGRRLADIAQGSEREIAIMFVDIRGFTAFSEGRLPYDVVFVLNRYFAAVGQAIEAAGGRVDKFIGDGVMALFGIAGDGAAGCRAALEAARLVSERLGELNRSVQSELDRPIRIGIGIHAGPVIVGEMGYGRASAMTAIGDAVNTASRLESLTKEYGCELVVSEEVVARAGIALAAAPRHQIEIRGRREALAIRVVEVAASLPPPNGSPPAPRLSPLAAAVRSLP